MAAEGRVVEVLGPVVEVEFPQGQLPAIYNALKVVANDAGAPGDGPQSRVSEGGFAVALEAVHHVGDNRVSCIAMLYSMAPRSSSCRTIPAIVDSFWPMPTYTQMTFSPF